MTNNTTSEIGKIVSVRGSFIDVQFDATLPPINTVLRTGKDGKIVIEVWAQLNAQTIRGIALTPTQGLARGMAVTSTGGPLKAPTGKAILARMFDVFGNVIDRGDPLENVAWRSVHRSPPSLAERSTKSEDSPNKPTDIRKSRPSNGVIPIGRRPGQWVPQGSEKRQGTCR